MISFSYKHFIPTGLLRRVLAALLTGECNPDLSALPPELASKIRELL
jgi:hypothetical protein